MAGLVQYGINDIFVEYMMNYAFYNGSRFVRFADRIFWDAEKSTLIEDLK